MAHSFDLLNAAANAASEDRRKRDAQDLARKLAKMADAVKNDLVAQALDIAHARTQSIFDAGDKLELSQEYSKLAHMLRVLAGDAQP